MFEIAQQLCLPGDPRKPNEDIVGFGKDYFFAMDGASSLSNVNVMGDASSDAAWMVRRVREDLCALLDAGDSRPTAELLRLVLLPLREEYLDACRRRGIEQPKDAPSACMAMFRQRCGNLEFFGLGDCVGMALLPDGSIFASVDTMLPALDAGVAAEMARLCAAEGITMMEARSRCTEMLLENRAKRNCPGGYWILDLLSDEGLSHAREAAWPLTGDPIVAGGFSDGFSQLSDVFGLYQDYPALFAAMRTGNLAELGAALTAAQEADAACMAHPRFKKRDDTCAVWGVFR